MRPDIQDRFEILEHQVARLEARTKHQHSINLFLGVAVIILAFGLAVRSFI
jgi:hypothetical protein